MDKIVIIDDKVDINIKFRTKTKGPELNLVYNFIDNNIHSVNTLNLDLVIYRIRIDTAIKPIFGVMRVA